MRSECDAVLRRRLSAFGPASMHEDGDATSHIQNEKKTPNRVLGLLVSPLVDRLQFVS